MKNKYIILFSILLILNSPCYASFSKFTAAYEKFRHNQTKQEKETVEKRLEEKTRRVDYLEKEQIRVYKRDHCQNNRACRQTPPNLPNSFE